MTGAAPAAGDGTTAGPDRRPEPVPAPGSQPFPQPVPQPDRVPGSQREPDPDPAPEPVAEPVAAPIPVPGSQPVPQPVPGSVTEPVPAPGSTVSEAGSVLRSPVPDAVPSPGSQPVSEPVPQPVPEPVPQAVPVPEPETGPVPASPARPAWPPVAYWVRTTVAVVATLLVVAAARRVTHVLLLVVMAFVLAVGVDPMVRWLGRLGLRRGWAVTVIFVGLASFLCLFAVLLVPPLVQEIRQFAGALPGYVADLQARQDWLGSLARRTDAGRIQQFVADIPARVGSSVGTIVGVAGTVLGRVFDLFTIAILSIYFMLALPRLPDTVARLTRPAYRARVDAVLRRSLAKIGGYVSGNLITSAVCGVLTVLALVGLQVPYAVPLGLWAGVADLIPQVGSYLGAVPAILVALTEGPGHGLAAAAFFIAYQQFENYVLAPRVYQNAIDLSPAAVIVSTLVGGTLAGFAGALLALPVAATLKVVMTDVVLADRLGPSPDGPAAPPDTAGPAAPPDTAAPARRRRRHRRARRDTVPEPPPPEN